MTIDEILDALRATRKAHMLSEGASEDQLAKCESDLGLIIPDTYRTFLRFSNGAVLYETEDLLGTTRSWDLAETIPDVVERLRSSSNARLPDGLLPFYRGPENRYLCFTNDRSHHGRVIEWLEHIGFGPQTFGSFEQWFTVAVYNEYHWRYLP